ncbi:MAG: putative small lipoprotein YifL [Gammaproteobacteria bacterium]|jgi:predicted small lipoprotein YifL|tara:strand:- start:206 stop:424 length:219 start_codon:yes stop_codon:yes gene_type:complete
MIGIHPRVLLLGIIFSAGLTACGQSGALYLPGSEAANSASSTPNAEPVADEQTELTELTESTIPTSNTEVTE